MIGVGEYGRASGGGVFVVGNDRGLIQSIGVDRDEDCEHPECELTAWVPTRGERVAEYNNADCVTGAVLEARDGTSLVMWTGFVEPQVWQNTKLEPAFS